MTDTHYVIMFDVFNDRRRRRLVKFLENFGYRIQYSVFAMEVDERKLEHLRYLINLAINEEEDSVFIFPLAEFDWSKKIIIGKEGDGLKQLENKLLFL